MAMHNAVEQVKENHCQCPQSVQLAGGTRGVGLRQFILKQGN